MASHYGELFDAALRRLRLANLLTLPVSVKTVEPPLVDGGVRLCGSCEPLFDNDDEDFIVGFKIVIERNLHLDLAVDTLVHEWAHAMDLEMQGTRWRKAHRNTWGNSYAKAYRAVHRE